jgi:hypothetical protein
MAVRKRESKLFDRIKKNIKNVHFTRIESISSPLAELLETLQSNMRP